MQSHNHPTHIDVILHADIKHDSFILPALHISDACVTVNNHYGHKNHNTTDETGYYELETIADLLEMIATTDKYKKSGIDFAMADEQVLRVNVTNDPIKAFNMTYDLEMTPEVSTHGRKDRRETSQQPLLHSGRTHTHVFQDC